MDIYYSFYKELNLYYNPNLNIPLGSNSAIPKPKTEPYNFYIFIE